MSDTELVLLLAMLPGAALAAGSILLLGALHGDAGAAHRYDGGGQPRDPPHRPLVRPPGASALPDASPARLRLRDHGRRSGPLPRPPRRQPRERRRHTPTCTGGS